MQACGWVRCYILQTFTAVKFASPASSYRTPAPCSHRHINTLYERGHTRDCSLGLASLPTSFSNPIVTPRSPARAQVPALPMSASLPSRICFPIYTDLHVSQTAQHGGCHAEKECPRRPRQSLERSP